MKELKAVSAILLITALCFSSCSKKNAGEQKSMDQIYVEQGRPVNVKTVSTEPFSVYYKYPADYRARSQSTAYSKINDVVRKVNAKVGDKVHRDDVIIVFSEDNSTYQQAKLQYENAQSAFNRTSQLYQASGVSKQDFDNVKTQYELAKESYKAASEMIQVKAPIDGTITQINVGVSSNTSAGMPLFTVSNQDGYEADFYVLPEEIADIKIGAPAFIEYHGEKISGVITEVSMTMDSLRRAFPVKAYFSGKSNVLVSGMNVDVSVEAYKNPEAVTVLQKEMVRANDVWSVYVVLNNTAVKKQVNVGRQDGLRYEITDGLIAGDVLITDGTQNVTDGEKVRVVE